MNRFKRYFLVILFLSMQLFSYSLTEKTYPDMKIKRVVRVYDGDTVYVDLYSNDSIIGDYIGIRIDGIDTPEIRGTKGNVKILAIKAKYYVEIKCKNAKEIWIRNCHRDKYFRIRADLYIDGKSIAEELIQLGYAKPYHGESKHSIWN